jgi:ribonuclease D
VADPIVLERLAKAGGYFREKFETILQPCVQGLEVESDNKEVRKRITEAIKLVRQECAIKLAAVQACGADFSPSRYLRALSTAAMEAERSTSKTGSIYTEADVGHPELFRELRQWRTDKAKDEGVAPFQVLHQKTLIQIAVHLPDSLKALKAIKGIGKRLAEKYGAEIVAMVAAYRSKNRIDKVVLPNPVAIGPTGERKKAGTREDTKKLSLDMLHSGLSIPEIAAQRGLNTQTVEGHLAYFVKAGTIPIDGLLPDDRLRALEERIASIQAHSLKDFKTALGDDYSYGEINLVLAHLQHRDSG